MVRVLTYRGYRVSVFAEAGGQHHEAHCHVYWSDGSCVIAIESLRVLAGQADRVALQLVRDNQERIRAVWSQLNP